MLRLAVQLALAALACGAPTPALPCTTERCGSCSPGQRFGPSAVSFDSCSGAPGSFNCTLGFGTASCSVARCKGAHSHADCACSQCSLKGFTTIPLYGCACTAGGCGCRALKSRAGAGAAAPTPSACWKTTYGRGVGTIPESCVTPPNTDKDGALCYPPCKTAVPTCVLLLHQMLMRVLMPVLVLMLLSFRYYGVGPVCWQHCPKGWVDEGALCRKDGSIETKVKKTYGRGVGKVMGCALNHTEDAALCYPNCKPGMDGVGPVCWQDCPAADPTNGGALCCKDSATCSSKILKISLGLPLAVAKALLAGDNVTKIEKAAKAAVEAILGFVMPLCV